MDKKEIMETIQLNRKDKKNGIVLIFIASLLAFVTAIYGAFRFGKKKGTSAERSSETEKVRKSDAERVSKTQQKLKKTAVSQKDHTRSVSKRSTEARRKKTIDETAAAPTTVVYKYVTPQPVYVVNPLQEKKRESRGKRFIRHMCGAAAAILLITMVGSTAMQSVETPTALAKESFSGIGEIVKDHDDDNPYKILDIVPADAIYADNYIFPIGSMGYLVNGQASISENLENIFKNKKETFYEFDKRQEMTDNIIMPNNTLGVKYEEAYGGVDTISESAGWIQIFDKTDVPDTGDSSGGDDGSSTDSLTYATGQFYGTLQGDANGDYALTFSTIPGLAVGSSLASPEAIYELHESGGAFRLSFTLMDGSEDMVGGYIAHEIGEMSDHAYSDTTCIYIYDESSGTYRYVGTIADIIGRHYDLNGGKKPGKTEPENPEVTEPEKPEVTEPVVPEEPEGGDVTDPDENQDDDETITPGEGGDNNQGNEDENNTDIPPTTGDNGDESTNNEDESSTDDDSESDNTDIDTLQINDIGEPIVRAITFTDGWHLLVEENGEETTDSTSAAENEDTTDDEPSNDNVDTSGSTDTPSYENPVDNGPSNDEIDWSQFSEFKIVVFEYVEEPWEGATLYKVDDVQEINPADGVPYPFDSYDIEYPISTLASRGINLGIAPIMTSPDSATPIEAEAVLIYDPNGNVEGRPRYSIRRTNNKNDADSHLIEVQGAPVYFRCTTNNDWIKEYVFCTLSDGDNKSDDFKIEVITMRADQVTAADVKDADLIFLESDINNVILNTGAMKLSYIDNDESGYGDMPDAAVKQILQCAAKDLTPVIVDYDIVDSENYEDSNYQYLAKAFLKDYLEEFYDKMDEKGEFMENLKMNVKDSDDFPVNDDNDFNYVNRNVYIVNDDTPLVSEDFPDEFDRNTARAGFSEVLDAIRAENTTLSDDDEISEQVSKARAVQYIINYSVGIIGEFEDLRILEIQPSANLESDLHREDGNKKLVWKTESMTTAKQILSSKKEFNVDIDVKSVVEFNGEWEDINGNYDMIFIGLDGQRLNLDDDGKTVYNNSDLDGKVYHSGDNSDSGRGPYDANDLTGQKMEELLDFMEAGYPIVVENNCFVKGSAQDSGSDGINHAYIQEGTAMDHFLQTAVSNPKYEDYIFSVSDVTASAMFMTQVRISKPRISLIEENGEAASKTKVLTPNDQGEYHGEVYYKIESNRGGDYVGNPVVKVYADYNYDGYFIPAEEVTEFVSEGNMLDIRIDGMGPGILPFKIEVSDAGNAYRRDSVQGYFRLAGSVGDEMKILQITEKKGEDNWQVDLQQMFDKVENSMLAYYLRGVETSFDMEMQFETVTASQLETKLTDNSGYLEQYDVVVLTLDNAAGSSAVADAVNRYVVGGRSLLVCGQDPGEQRAGLDSTLLGQTDGRTFVNIGTGGKYLRYAGLKGDMFDGKTNLKVEPVNEGSISCFPYVIDGSFTLGDTGALKAAPYQLNLEDNLRSESETNSFVTAWYTFGSNDSKGSAYGISPRDARNNYYCYSKGNVVYLAQSEYAYVCDAQSGPSSGDVGASECQFFVNALFAAYSAGLHNAHINIVSGFSSDAADIESISVPFDEAWLEAVDDTTGGILDNTVDVFFKFRDNNIASQKTTWVSFYREASDEEGGVMLPVNGKEIKAVPFNSEVWTVTDNRLVQADVNALQPGKVYRIEAPVITLQNLRGNETANKADIYIVLHTVFVRNGQFYEIITTDAVSLNRARLFRLE